MGANGHHHEAACHVSSVFGSVSSPCWVRVCQRHSDPHAARYAGDGRARHGLLFRSADYCHQCSWTNCRQSGQRAAVSYQCVLSTSGGMHGKFDIDNSSSAILNKCDSQVYDNVQVGVQPAAKLEALWTAPVASPESPISFSALLSKGPASTVDLVSWDAPAPSPAASCGCCSHSCSSILKVGGLDVRFEWQIDMAGTDDCTVADCTVRMNATAPADAWVGVGVGDAMDGSVLMVASKGATSWTAEPYTLSGHDAPSAKYTGG